MLLGFLVYHILLRFTGYYILSIQCIWGTYPLKKENLNVKMNSKPYGCMCLHDGDFTLTFPFSLFTHL